MQIADHKIEQVCGVGIVELGPDDLKAIQQTARLPVEGFRENWPSASRVLANVIREV